MLRLEGKLTLGDRSRVGPTVKQFKSKFYMAWTGTDSHINIAEIKFIPPSFGSDAKFEFVRKITLGEKSIESPALAVFDKRLYLAWTGTDNHINLISTNQPLNAESWGNKETFEEKSFSSPSFTDQGFLTWSGINNERNLNIALVATGIS